MEVKSGVITKSGLRRIAKLTAETLNMSIKVKVQFTL